MFTWIINIFKGKKNKNVITIDGGVSGNNLVAQHKPQIEQDPRKIILKDSRDRLNKLSIYMNYFNNKLVTDIFNQTQLIHDVFSENENLTFKKLEQYHYYYTDALIELLEKLKKSTDDNIAIKNTQIKSINNKIESSFKNITSIKSDLSNLDNLKMQYTNYMSMQISSIYNCLVEKFNDFRYKKSKDFKFFNYLVDDVTFWNMPIDTYISLVEKDDKNFYGWEDFSIEKILMGKLQKNLFLIDFIGCFNINDSQYLELFKFSDSNIYFVYDTKNFIFKTIKYPIVVDLCTDDNTKYKSIKHDLSVLENDRIKIEAELKSVKRLAIDKEVKPVLDKYLVKIEDLELLDKITEINIETKNLQVLLDLERLDI